MVKHNDITEASGGFLTQITVLGKTKEKLEKLAVLYECSTLRVVEALVNAAWDGRKVKI